MVNEPSKPKFKTGDMVKFTNEYRDKVIAQGYDAKNSNYVLTSKLHIYCEPSWNPSTKTWIYCYDYGFTGTSEGCTPETNIEPY